MRISISERLWKKTLMNFTVIHHSKFDWTRYETLYILCNRTHPFLYRINKQCVVKFDTAIYHIIKRFNVDVDVSVRAEGIVDILKYGSFNLISEMIKRILCY
jgi:hypothetical protein